VETTTQQGFLFDIDKLEETAARLAPEFQSAEPFPHVVMDDLWPDAVLDGVLAEFPKPDELNWIRYERDNEVKLASKGDLQLGEFTRNFVFQLNSATFINILERLTGIEGLIPDPHLKGGGLHQIERGGYLKVHADFNHHARLKLYRRLNLIIYLNHDWDESYGGALQLWDKEMTKCEREVLPVFNRSVLFATRSDAFHGHPEPLTCPEDRTRRSLALYYYTAERAPDAKRGRHTTRWQERPGAHEPEASASRQRTKEMVRKFIPPIVWEIKSSIASRRAR
jgi:hypothetical protein